MISCTNRKAIEGYNIIKVEENTDSTSKYTVNSDQNASLFNWEKPAFFAKKGLYNVGDTLKFCKWKH